MPTCAQCKGEGYNVSTVPSSRDPKGYREIRYRCFACNGKGFYGHGPSEEQQVDTVKESHIDGLLGCSAVALIVFTVCVVYFLYYVW